MRTRAQSYASSAFEKVKEFQTSLAPGEDGDKAKKAYGSMAHKFPVLVRMAGLAQAVAFVEARGKDPHRKLLEDLAVVLGKQDRKNLYEASRTEQLLEYMMLTRQVLEAGVWFKRFAASVLKVDDGEDTELDSD